MTASTTGAFSLAGGLSQRLRQPRVLLSIALLALAGGVILAFLYARGELAGADARVYWASVRLWLAGADPFTPPVATMPYAYSSWSLYLFLPWALLPWDFAWFAWRAANVALFAASVGWAYGRHPLATAALVAALGVSLAANLDTGNINILLALAIWVGWFAGPRLAGAAWALGAALKWLPVVLLVFVPRRAWPAGLATLGLLLLLTLATWPDTLRQLGIVTDYPRPLRIDYLVLAWAAVPWLWTRDWSSSRAWPVLRGWQRGHQ
ncbi:MAG TPA: glycosyltransferase 87 family protein [Candidatus Limnocylindria bacterium]|nr:glycosyltransferase 87 family protein [Candidatus Limnocylindria bacterium]